MKDIDLKSKASLFNSYTELRLQENTVGVICMNKGNLIQNAVKSTGGVSARVNNSGSWGFASCPELTDESIAHTVKTAQSNASFLAEKRSGNPLKLPGEAAQGTNLFKTERPRKTQKELVEIVKEIDHYIESNCRNINSSYLYLNTLDMYKKLTTTGGSESESLIPRSTITVKLTTEKENEPVDLYIVTGGLGQFEDVFNSLDELYSRIDEMYEHLQKKREAVYARSGLQECILGPGLAGILAHEAIGHTTEADLVLGGSVAGGYIGEQVASELITLTDFAHTALGETCPVPLYVDDEGVTARDMVLIDKGILKGFMHNRESARHFQARPTGNARAYEYSDEPLIRMRNTAILPGKDSLQEMIASVEDGYYLIKASNGEADSTSEFMFGVPLGYEIKNGKIGRAIKDTTISGIAFDMLKTVTMVSDDMIWSSGGMCGKKQLIPVGMGGPAVKCRVQIGGRG